MGSFWVIYRDCSALCVGTGSVWAAGAVGVAIVFAQSEVCFIDIVTRACDNERTPAGRPRRKGQDAGCCQRMQGSTSNGDAVNDAGERIIKL